MYKKIFFLLVGIFLIVGFTISSKTYKDCEQFRNGKFMYHLDPPNNDIIFIIERKDSIQIETEPRSGKYSKFSLKWVEPCIYEVKLLETTFNFPDSIQQIRKTIPFRTKILSGTSDYYIYQGSRGEYNTMDTMWVLK